jgi:hypothetical protein
MALRDVAGTSSRAATFRATYPLSIATLMIRRQSLRASAACHAEDRLRARATISSTSERVMPARGNDPRAGAKKSATKR